MERSGWRLASAAMPQLRRRQRLCKRSAASALQKNLSISFSCADNFLHKRFEARVASQRIKVRINLDEINFETTTLACIFFEPSQRLVLLSKREVDQSKAVTRHVTRLSHLSKLSRYRARFFLLSNARLGMAHKREHSG